MVLAGKDFDDGVGAELFERFLQQLCRAFKVKCVEAAVINVELSFKLRAERLPIPFENEPDVVFFPSLGRFQIDRAGFAIVERSRAAVFVERTEDGLERVELTAVADHVFHSREVLVEEHRLLAHSRQRTPLALTIVKHVLIRRI